MTHTDTPDTPDTPDSPDGEAPLRRVFRLPAIEQERHPFRREILEVMHDVLSEFETVEVVEGPVGPGGFGEVVYRPPGEDSGGPGRTGAEVDAAGAGVAQSGAAEADVAGADVAEADVAGVAPETKPVSLDSLDLSYCTPLILLRAAARLRRALHGGGRRASARELEVLVVLEVARRPKVSPAEVAGCLGRAEQTIHGVVERLVGRGEVSRTAGGSDRRRRLLTLTPVGVARAEREARRYQDVDELLLGRLTPTERDRLRSMLRRTARLLGNG